MARKRNSIKEEPYGDGLVKSFDNLGYYIRQNETGILYAEAIDVPGKYTYSETNEVIPNDTDNG